jgi:hypothetical protein
MPTPTGSALYAALSEHIYRRDEANDQAIKLSDIGVAPPINLSGLASLGLNLTQEGGYIYSTGGGTGGFCAMVSELGGKFIVTIRGTDSTVSAWSSTLRGLWNAASSLNSPPPPADPATLVENVVDAGDGYTSGNLGRWCRTPNRSRVSLYLSW